jgi:hypothetical protein
MMWSLGASKHTHIVSFDIRVRRGCGRRYAGAAAPCAASPCPSSCCRRQQARAPSAARRQWFPRPEEGRPAPQAPPCCYSHREGQGNGNGRGGSALRYLAKGTVPSVARPWLAKDHVSQNRAGLPGGEMLSRDPGILQNHLPRSCLLQQASLHPRESIDACLSADSSTSGTTTTAPRCVSPPIAGSSLPHTHTHATRSARHSMPARWRTRPHLKQPRRSPDRLALLCF